MLPELLPGKEILGFRLKKGFRCQVSSVRQKKVSGVSEKMTGDRRQITEDLGHETDAGFQVSARQSPPSGQFNNIKNLIA